MKTNEGRLGLGLMVGLALLMSMFSLGVITTQAEAAIVPQWTAATPLNDTHAQAVVVQDEDGLVYIIGGVNTLSYVPIANVSSYDMETGDWTDLAPLPQATRGAAGAYYDGKIYVIGGFSGMGYLTNNQVYDIATDTWSSMAPIPVGAWESRAAASSDGRIFVFGGESGAMYWSSAVYIYDIEDDSWSSGTNMPVGVKSGAVVGTGYTFYYLGGEVSGGSTTAAVNVYYTWGTWESAAPMPQAKATFAAVEGADSFIYVFGGGIGANNVGVAYNTSYCYDRWNDVWYDGPDMNFNSRNLGGAASEDGWIFAIGGNDNAVMHPEVDSMQIMSAAASLDPDTVATGRPVLVTVTVDFAFAVPVYYSVDAELVSGTGVSYGSEYFDGSMGTTFVFSFDVPDGIPAGAYALVMESVNIGLDSGQTYLPELRLPLVVVVGDTLDEQIESLQNEIALLQAQLMSNHENTTVLVMQMTGLLSALADLQEQVDRIEDKADMASTYGLISMILIVIVIVLVFVIIMMARKGGS